MREVTEDQPRERRQGQAGITATYPFAVGPAGAWSQCPAAWLPGCEEGYWCHSGRAEHSGRGCTSAGIGAQQTPTLLLASTQHGYLHPHHYPCPQTFGEGLRPRVATLSCEEEDEEPEEEGRGPLRALGRELAASPSILER